jgi:hypothetical protein
MSFFDDQIEGAELAGFGQDLCASIVAVLLDHVAQLRHDDLEQQLVAGQDRRRAFDQLEDFGELVEDLLPLRGR